MHNFSFEEEDVLQRRDDFRPDSSLNKVKWQFKERTRTASIPSLVLLRICQIAEVVGQPLVRLPTLIRRCQKLLCTHFVNLPMVERQALHRGAARSVRYGARSNRSRDHSAIGMRLAWGGSSCRVCSVASSEAGWYLGQRTGFPESHFPPIRAGMWTDNPACDSPTADRGSSAGSTGRRVVREARDALTRLRDRLEGMPELDFLEEQLQEDWLAAGRRCKALLNSRPLIITDLAACRGSHRSKSNKRASASERTYRLMKFSAGIWRRLSSAYGWPVGSPVARSDKQETTSLTWAGNESSGSQFSSRPLSASASWSSASRNRISGCFGAAAGNAGKIRHVTP